jgi:hypothetical protein
MQPVTRTFIKAYDAFRFAEFCIYNDMRCKLGKESGSWYVVY